jgi:hypothetical protein
MPKTYTPIATLKLSSDTSGASFTNIPQTYTDLIVVFNGNGSGGTTGYNNYTFTFNNDTASNYSRTRLQGDGTNVGAVRDSNVARHDIFVPNAGEGPGTSIINIMNYSNTTTFKTALWRDSFSATGGYVIAWAGLWRNTAAITRIDFPNTFKAGSSWTLYGILKA